jgi:hypothetical protein
MHVDRKFIEDLQERIKILFRPIKGGGEKGATEQMVIFLHFFCPPTLGFIRIYTEISSLLMAVKYCSV